jgi:hypothetical protein
MGGKGKGKRCEFLPTLEEQDKLEDFRDRALVSYLFLPFIVVPPLLPLTDDGNDRRRLMISKTWKTWVVANTCVHTMEVGKRSGKLKYVCSQVCYGNTF